MNQLTAHLNFFDLFAPVQSAYLRHHSPETALLRVVNDMGMVVDAGDAALLSLLDKSAAFDTIDHSTLLNRLSVRYGVTGVALSWFSSYLSGRCQSVSLRGVSSTPKPLRYGVPQGSVLGPILYILYTSPVCDIANQHSVPVHFYANDTQHMVRFALNSDGSPQKVAFSALSRYIAETKEWMTTNKLKLNEAKTECLLVFSDSSRVKPISMPLMVGSSPVLPSIFVHYLGAGLDSQLSLEAQIFVTRKKALFHFSRISRLKRFLSKPALAQLLHAFVLSTLDCNNSLLVGCPESKLCVFQKVQIWAARLATGCNRRDHITPYLKSLHWLPVRQRIDSKISLLMFNCLNRTAPSHLTSLVTRYEPPSSLRRLSSRPELVVPRIKSKKYGSTSFSYAGPAIWNSLHFSVRSSTTLAQFRSSLKTHLCRVCFRKLKFICFFFPKSLPCLCPYYL